MDAGISFRSLKERLSSIGVDLSQIDAVLITHEHGDHIRGLKQLVSKCQIPIFANAETGKALLSTLNFSAKIKVFSTGESFEFGDLLIYPFSIQHDTLDPVAFTFEMGKVKVGLCTDLGFVTTTVKWALQKCDYLCIEANHEPALVHGCARPPLYKQRVLGRQGHLSNQDCANLIDAIYHQEIKHIYLAHLSEECNTPQIAIKKIQEKLGEKKVSLSIAYPNRASEPIRLGSQAHHRQFSC